MRQEATDNRLASFEAQCRLARERAVDRAVREGIHRTVADGGVDRKWIESDYAVRGYFMPNILAAWREQSP